MSNKPNWKATFLAVAMITALILTSCATPTPEVIEKVVTQVVEQEVTKEVQVEVTKEVEVVVTATPEPPGDGNTLAFGQWGTTTPNNFCTLAPTTRVEQIWLREFLSASLATVDENGEWAPDLAEGWEVSDDGMDLVFHLRQDVTWHDGAPFTIQDVVFTLDLMTSEAFPHYAAIFGDVIADVEPIDDYTVRLHMQRPVWPDGIGAQSVFGNLVSWNPVPAHLLADGAPEEICSTDWAQENYVGLGPFAVDTFDPNNFAIYKPYEFYYGELSQLQELKVSFSSEPDVLFTKLVAGELDMAQITPRLVDIVKETDHLIMAPNASLVAVNTNRSAWPPADPHVRQALTNPPGKSSVPFRQPLSELPIGDAFLLPQQGETEAAIAALGEVLKGVRVNQARAVTIEDEGETVHWALLGPESAPMPADIYQFWDMVAESGELVVGTVAIERAGDKLVIEPAAAVAVIAQEPPELMIELRDPGGEVLSTYYLEENVTLKTVEPDDEIPVAGIDLGTRWCWGRIFGCWFKYPCGW
jgi:hypothetical protein